jgi:hypothetical protein
VDPGDKAFWDDLTDLCEWAFADQGDYFLQELGIEDCWVYQLTEDDTLVCWRATLSHDFRWTLSPVY